MKKDDWGFPLNGWMICKLDIYMTRFQLILQVLKHKNWPFGQENRFFATKKHLKIAFFLCARIWKPNGWHQVNFRPTPENFGVWRSKLAQTSNLSQISQIISVEKNLSCGEISDFCKEFEQFMEFYQNLCRFCSKFVWRKICVEKKMTNIRFVLWACCQIVFFP